MKTSPKIKMSTTVILDSTYTYIDANTQAVFSNEVRPVPTQMYGPDYKELSSLCDLERTRHVTRITLWDCLGIVQWGILTADPFDKATGMILSPERLPTARLRFVGTSTLPIPPPDHTTIKISSNWSVPRDDGSIWPKLYSKPIYADLCNVLSLKIPSALRGSHDYLANLQVWPKHSGQKPSDNLNETIFATNIIRDSVHSDLSVTPRVD